MSLLLIGEYNHNVDAKGRLSVPFKFREDLGSKVVVGRGPDKCLRIYSYEQFEKFVDSLEEQLDTSLKEDRDLFRNFTAKVDRCEFDSQGRIILSKNLREYAGITKEVKVIGNGKVAEVWDRETYEENFPEEEYTSEKMSKKISEKKLRF